MPVAKRAQRSAEYRDFRGSWFGVEILFRRLHYADLIETDTAD
jgi:hypothetical protein